MRHWLLWDGDCEFCRACVDWVAERDSRRLFVALPYQLAPSPPMTPELYERCRKAVQVLTADGRILGAGRAVAFVFSEIGHRFLGGFLMWPVMRAITEWGYRRVANNRRLFGRLAFGKTCKT